MGEVPFSLWTERCKLDIYCNAIVFFSIFIQFNRMIVLLKKLKCFYWKLQVTTELSLKKQAEEVWKFEDLNIILAIKSPNWTKFWSIRHFSDVSLSLRVVGSAGYLKTCVLNFHGWWRKGYCCYLWQNNKANPSCWPFWAWICPW